MRRRIDDLEEEQKRIDGGNMTRNNRARRYWTREELKGERKHLNRIVRGWEKLAREEI